MTRSMMLISGIKAIKMALMTICKPEQDKKRYFSFLKDGTDSCEYIDNDVV